MLCKNKKKSRCLSLSVGLNMQEQTFSFHQVHIFCVRLHRFVSCFSLETMQCSWIIQFRLKGTYAIVTVPTNANLNKCPVCTETWTSITWGNIPHWPLVKTEHGDKAGVQVFFYYCKKVRETRAESRKQSFSLWLLLFCPTLTWWSNLFTLNPSLRPPCECTLHMRAIIEALLAVSTS